MAIYQIVYASFIIDTDESTADAIIDDILAISRKNNPSKNITGLLLYNAGVFVQLLEGDEANVTELYEKIENDPRHHNTKLILKQNNHKRLFEEWSMGFKKLHNDDLSVFNALLSMNSIGDSSEKEQILSNDIILKELTKFRGTLDS